MPIYATQLYVFILKMNRSNTLVMTQLFMLVLISSPLWASLVFSTSNGFGLALLLALGGILLLVFLPVCLILLWLWHRYKKHSIVSIVLINVVSVPITLTGIYLYHAANEYHRKSNPPTWSEENQSEMRSLGATLIWGKGRKPDTVRVTPLTDRQALSVPSLSFLASFEHLSGSIANQSITPNSEANYPFKMVFSRMQDNNFVVLTEDLPILTVVIAAPHYDDFGQATVVSSNVSGLFPAAATHIEFWKTNTSKQQVELLLRIPLAEFYAWKKFIQPYVAELQQPVSKPSLDRTSRKTMPQKPVSPAVNLSRKAAPVKILRGSNSLEEFSSSK